MIDQIKILFVGFLSFLLLTMSGCVSLKTQEGISIKKFPKSVRQGVYHKVKRGETLWRIAKTYDVAVHDIIEINNIPKAAKIEKNQLVFIPGVNTVKEIVLDAGSAQNEFMWPIQGKVIKYFHERYGDQVNKGIDIEARVGDQVKAARTGRVVFADYLSGYGYTVILDHLDGFHSVYAKNSKLLVKLGELVLRSGTIAQVGHSSNLAYVHFEIRKKTIEDNPLYYLP